MIISPFKISPFGLKGSSAISYDQATIDYMNALGIADDATVYFDGAQEKTGSELWAIVNSLVTSIKSASLWDKLYIIYPYLGATAARNKFNLKAPFDNNASFRQTFSGGVTHNKYGVEFNAVDGYADTKFTPVGDGLSESTGMHFSFYSRRSVTNAGYLLGSYPNSFYYADTDRYIGIGNGYTLHSGATNINSINIINRASNSTSERHVVNGTLSSAKTKAFSTFGAPYFLIGKILDGATSYYPTAATNFGFVTVGEGLTGAEETALNSAISSFITSLAR